MLIIAWHESASNGQEETEPHVKDFVDVLLEMAETINHGGKSQTGNHQGSYICMSYLASPIAILFQFSNLNDFKLTFIFLSLYFAGVVLRRNGDIGKCVRMGNE
jgi:hypothetical protein